MVRKHGWQLPAHTLQVIAITVFCLLVVAYYAFFAPFVGGRIWEYVLIGVYSPVALLVFVLYVRCTAINPADPRIMSIFDTNVIRAEMDNGLSRSFDEIGSQLQSSPSIVTRSSNLAANSSVKGSVGDDQRVESNTRKACYNPLAIFCCVFVLEDCYKQEETVEQEGNIEEALFCTLCNCEVRRFSKHCRSCDKCVDCFDHHCKWLNNCIGRKNYVTFVSLMASSLLWLIIEAAVGVAVIVRVSVHKKSMSTEIVNRLGNSFSPAPLAAVVGFCTAVAILACYHLGELLFFHMILIKKGITTYEYVIAMRAMSEAPDGASVDEENQNVLYSPTGSATTGFSRGSSLGLPYKGVWCTPPRVFDDQDEVIPHLDPRMLPSTVDPDAAGSAERGIKALKKPVKRNAWKLAKLDPNEAARAAAKARASSSVLKLINNRHFPDNELSSIGTVSISSSVSKNAKMAASKEIRNNDPMSSLSRDSFAPSQGSRDEYDTESHCLSNLSSPSHVHESVTLAPLPQHPTAVGHRVTATTHQMHSTFDEKVMHRGNDTDSLFRSAPATSLLRDVRKSSAVWDPEAGRYVSAPVTTPTDVRNRLPNPSSQTANTQNPRAILPSQDSSSGSSALRPPLPLHQAERRLTYTGDSIFYGGPLINIPTRDNPRSGRVSVRDGQDRLASTLHRDTRFRRDSTSNQLPVFAPGGHGKNSQPDSTIK
ncbi:putative protein S-acyltransferase 20 [Cardamine amara subsp. amara]|uniref:S-acyltransferase n=1 Tax=Cardamine amara subsp. amara TaxID=228776 RepID=A0ABD0ZSC6_CARAN